MMGRVGAYRCSRDRHITAHGIPKHFGQSFVSGVNMHAIEPFTAISKFSIVETDVARQFKDQRPLTCISPHGAFIIWLSGKVDQRQLARERHPSASTGRIDTA